MAAHAIRRQRLSGFLHSPLPARRTSPDPHVPLNEEEEATERTLKETFHSCERVHGHLTGLMKPVLSQEGWIPTSFSVAPFRDVLSSLLCFQEGLAQDRWSQVRKTVAQRFCLKEGEEFFVSVVFSCCARSPHELTLEGLPAASYRFPHSSNNLRVFPSSSIFPFVVWLSSVVMILIIYMFEVLFHMLVSLSSLKNCRFCFLLSSHPFCTLVLASVWTFVFSICRVGQHFAPLSPPPPKNISLCFFHHFS